MSLLRRAALSAARTLRSRGGGHDASKPSFSSAGVRDSEGRLFNESHPAPGTKRKWESWEAPWYLTLVTAGLTLGIGLRAQPDSRLTTWARGEARKELASDE